MLNEKLIGQNYFSASSWWATARMELIPQVRSEHFLNSPHWGNSMYFNEKPTGSAVGVIWYFIRIEFEFRETFGIGHDWLQFIKVNFVSSLISTSEQEKVEKTWEKTRRTKGEHSICLFSHILTINKSLDRDLGPKALASSWDQILTQIIK